MYRKLILILALLPVLAFSGIVSGVDTLDLQHVYNWQYMDLISGNVDTMSVLHTGFSLPSTTSAQGYDFFCILSHCTCVCLDGNSAPFGAFRPFYTLNTTFDSLNLKAPLNLANTLLFTRNDTNKTNSLLPYITISSKPATCVVTTSANTYALLKIVPIRDTTVCRADIFPDTVVNLRKFIVTRYVQENGTLDFSGISSAIAKSPTRASVGRAVQKGYRIAVGSRNIPSNATAVYSLKGERIMSAGIGRHNGLMIYK